MALRRTKKEAGLENTLPKMVGGSKEHQKGRQGCKTLYLRCEGSKAYSKIR